ncbi:hypothetical protein LPC08_04210 [Roseomonas sp. OT10]|uniref:hypothetical protein n=1 Tax=Roseomonas cutis TaxID=2897332 RepID=UPI001E39CE30|nr:hypothetical protein [Roseomonas sp. OT10]UFN49854.1 hypothetical protein LPC08_04210 [Roseomonas sp. OT10]
MAGPISDDHDTLLMEVLVAARRLLALQSRLDSGARAAGCLAEAIDRDFLLFDLHDAARDLREAVEAAEAITSARSLGGLLPKTRPVQAMSG